MTIHSVSPSELCKSQGARFSKHLDNRGTDKRPKIKPKMDSNDLQRIHPITTDLTKSQVVVFILNTGVNAVRFLPNCLNITLNAFVRNKDYVENSQDPAKKDEWSSMTPFNKTSRPFYFNPICSTPSALITEVELLIDGVLVQSERSGFLSFYSTLNNLFMSHAKRTEILGHPYILHNALDTQLEKDRVVANKTYINPSSASYYYALNEMNCQQAQDGYPISVKGNIDGIFGFSRPKNSSLNAIYNCSEDSNAFPLFPPHTEICLRLRLADPLHLRIIDSQIEDSTFFNQDTVPAGDVFPINDIKFEISEMTLAIQKYKFAEERVQNQLKGGSVHYNFDQYLYRATNLSKGQVNVINKERFPANINLVYVVYVRSNQLWKDGGAAARSSDGTRYTFPPNLETVTFQLNGVTILWENGLTINRNMCNYQQDAAMYYQYLYDRNLTTEPFDSFFPKTNIMGYKQAFVLDLTPFQIDQPCEITVTSHFAQPGSPDGYYLAMFSPLEVTIDKAGVNHNWTSTATIS